MNWRDWIDFGYGAVEFKRDVHVMICAVASELLLDLTGATACSWPDCLKRMGAIAAIAVLKSFIARNQP